MGKRHFKAEGTETEREVWVRIQLSCSADLQNAVWLRSVLVCCPWVGDFPTPCYRDTVWQCWPLIKVLSTDPCTLQVCVRLSVPSGYCWEKLQGDRML